MNFWRASPDKKAGEQRNRRNDGARFEIRVAIDKLDVMNSGGHLNGLKGEVGAEQRRGFSINEGAPKMIISLRKDNEGGRSGVYVGFNLI